MSINIFKYLDYSENRLQQLLQFILLSASIQMTVTASILRGWFYLFFLATKLRVTVFVRFTGGLKGALSSG